jgi:hypothetical protein
VSDSFLTTYFSTARPELSCDQASVTAHTACLVLARTDGKSLVQFLDKRGRDRAREVGIALLRKPVAGVWSWN